MISENDKLTITAIADRFKVNAFFFLDLTVPRIIEKAGVLI
jgi:hypothetical protein